MRGPDQPAGGGFDPARVALSLLWAVPGAGLAAFSHASLAAAMGVLAAGGVATGLLVVLGGRLGPAISLLPGVISLGWLAALALSGPGSEVLAGAGGLGVLVGYAQAAAAPDRRSSFVPALALPGAGVGIALATALIFPPAERLVGVASLLLAACVVALAFLLRRPAGVVPGEGGTS